MQPEFLPLRFLLLLSFALTIACPSAASQPVVAFGKVHGDYLASESVLQQANLVDENGNWSAGETIVIQTGDIADHRPDTRRILAELLELQQEAAAAGGQIIVVIGVIVCTV